MGHGTYDASGRGHLVAKARGAGRAMSACFADEIALDFPSVVPAIGRMRKAFVADLHPAALDAVVQISRHEASAGTTVRLRVPIRAECRPCGGRGEAWPGPCPLCEGHGVTVRPGSVEVRVPAGVRDGNRYRIAIGRPHTPSTRVEILVLVR